MIIFLYNNNNPEKTNTVRYRRYIRYMRFYYFVQRRKKKKNKNPLYLQYACTFQKFPTVSSYEPSLNLTISEKRFKTKEKQFFFYQKRETFKKEYLKGNTSEKNEKLFLNT